MGRRNKNKNKNKTKTKTKNEALPIRQSLNPEATTFVPKDEEPASRPETRELISFTNNVWRLELMIATQQTKPSTLLFKHHPQLLRHLFDGQSLASHHLDRSQQDPTHQAYPRR
jgi:hypothetical protein